MKLLNGFAVLGLAASLMTGTAAFAQNSPPKNHSTAKGAVAGAVVGHEVGSGHAVAGAVAGAAIGHHEGKKN